jgi:DNA-binding response OmpR family regulator
LKLTCGKGAPKGRHPIRLQDQPFEILAMMLERAGGRGDSRRLSRRLWPAGTFVDFEHSLNAAVKRLRAALGDEADNPRFVETLHRARLTVHCARRIFRKKTTERRGARPDRYP